MYFSEGASPIFTSAALASSHFATHDSPESRPELISKGGCRSKSARGASLPVPLEAARHLPAISVAAAAAGSTD